MFGRLIESRAVRQRHTGSSVASVLIHSVIITGGVIATAKDMTIAPPDPVIAHHVTFTRTADPTPPTTRPDASSSRDVVATAPVVRRLSVSSIVPVGIPPVDLNASTPSFDFGHGTIETVGIFCGPDCPTPSTDAAGRQLWSANDVMMRLLQDPVPPRYPESLRRAGVEGDVTVQFVVDTTGRVDMRSIEVLRSTHDAFTAAVRETLEKLRFAPGAAGERKVRALAVMPFHFTLK
jgi:protein TonB